MNTRPRRPVPPLTPEECERVAQAGGGQTAQPPAERYAAAIARELARAPRRLQPSAAARIGQLIGPIGAQG